MNFKKNAVSQSKQTIFTWYGNEQMQKSKKWISLLTLFIVIILTFFVAFMVFKNYELLQHLNEISKTNKYFLGTKTAFFSVLIKIRVSEI